MAIFYRPPADIGDFARSAAHADALRGNWDRFIGGHVAGRDGGLFYDAAHDPAPGVPADRVSIPWNGFPRTLSMWFNADTEPDGWDKALRTSEVLRPLSAVVTPDGAQFFAWRPGFAALRAVRDGALAEEVFPRHRQQDEYCEWHVDRDDNGGIRRVTFTAEGPEYWSEMARIDLALVTALYQQHVDASVVADDLVWAFDVAAPVQGSASQYARVFRKGEYNPYNPWNTSRGAMHLTHPANTLGAEINLAADATVLYPAVATAPAASLPARLICCAQYGGVNRSSDPNIGAAVNDAARDGRMVTLANPVGLYMGTIEVDSLRGPDGQSIGAQSLAVTRASADGTMILRAVLTPPEGAAFTLDQCTFGGESLRGGAQVAKRITMSLFGLVKRTPVPGRAGVSATCHGRCCAKPDAPNFRVPVDATQDCAALGADDFAAEAPWTEDDVLSPTNGFEALTHAHAIEESGGAVPFAAARVSGRGLRGGRG
jgi:hypothetical protein